MRIRASLKLLALPMYTLQVDTLNPLDYTTDLCSELDKWASTGSSRVDEQVHTGEKQDIHRPDVHGKGRGVYKI